VKTGEMYVYVLANPKAKFTQPRSLNNAIYEFDKHGNLKVLIDGELKFCDTPPKPDDNWDLVREPVDFMTAINSESEIMYENWIDYASVDMVLDILANKMQGTALRMINGKWYIK